MHLNLQGSPLPQDKSLNASANLRIGITGATGSLGTSLIKRLRAKGAFVIGLTHQSIEKYQQSPSKESPNEWIQWECGQEAKLGKVLETLDILILNHGINPGRDIKNTTLNKVLEINALSTWRLLESFEKIALSKKSNRGAKEIWINTSEAEVQPALSPGYELSKRLIGQLISLKWASQTNKEKSSLKIRKLILGPFRSKLNPIGIMNPDLVANQILNQIILNSSLIIVTPNPLTFLLVPLNELARFIYFKLLKSEI